MRLVVIHYHLNRGGVTSVIRSHLQSLAHTAQDLDLTHVGIAYGGRATDWEPDFETSLPFQVSHLVVPQLEYDELHTEAGDLFLDLEQMFASCGFQRTSTVLHVHNHALGKNTALPHAMSQFANQGWKVFFQFHDFVEDLRPQNYSNLVSAYGDPQSVQAALYPQAPQIHSSALNQSDVGTLREAGIDVARLHLLPNPVSAAGAIANRTDARKKLANTYAVSADTNYVLYPVRGIRRKNVGEVLLWSLLLNDCVFAITLEPKNELERSSYLSWKDFAESRSISVLFGTGKRLSLDENYAAADAVISTSVAEGFGLVFLEAATRDRPLFGRDLPGVTADFVANGMKFPGLSPKMLVPTQSFDTDALQATYVNYLEKLARDYGASDQFGTAPRNQLLEWFKHDVFDFGRLDRTQQRTVIEKAREDGGLRQEIAELNPLVSQVKRSLFDGHTLLHDCLPDNRSAIRRDYSHETIGTQLVDIYTSMMGAEVEPITTDANIGHNLLKRFVSLESLLPLRVEP